MVIHSLVKTYMFTQQPKNDIVESAKGVAQPNTEEKRRTVSQNRALWLFFELLADKLNSSGLDMKAVLKPQIEIPWSKQTIHDFLWVPVQDLQLGKKSTTELTTSEVSAVYETLNRFLAEKHGISEPFPSVHDQLRDLDFT